MTYQGAIDELKSLENNESMPDWFKPTLKKKSERQWKWTEEKRLIS